MSGVMLLTAGFVYFNPRVSLDLIKGTAQATYILTENVIDLTVKGYKIINEYLPDAQTACSITESVIDSTIEGYKTLNKHLQDSNSESITVNIKESAVEDYIALNKPLPNPPK